MSDDGAPGVTSEAAEIMQRLWARPGERRRGPKPSLSVPVIVEAAVELADAEGLPAVSMARVAETLNCTAMALYRHVTSKDELLALLADRVAAEAPEIPDGLRWREGLTLWAQVQIDGVMAHPWVLDLQLAATPLGPHRARWIDRGFAAMRTLDLPIHEKGQILSLLSQYVLAEARVLVELRQAASSPYADLARSIDQLAAVEDLPDLFAALADESSGEADDSFAIELILDGIAARRRRRQRQERSQGSAAR